MTGTTDAVIDRQGGVLVLYYSRTGTGARVARDASRLLQKEGAQVTVCPIEPRLELPYPLWLLLSFIPGLPTSIQKLEPSPEEFDRCLLVIPKWTFNCPPVEEVLSSYASRLPRTLLLVTCGGWDEDRYTERYRSKFARKGVEMVGAAALRCAQVGKPHFLKLLGYELTKLLKAD